MIARGIFRGGLVGGMLAAAFSVLGIIPVCGFFAFPLRIAAWALGGYMAGRIASGRGDASGVAAGLGAGIMAGVIDGLTNIALAPVAFKMMGNDLPGLALLPEPLIKHFLGLGIDLMQMNTVGGSIFFATLFCSVGWLLAGIIGMLGGGVAQALTE